MALPLFERVEMIKMLVTFFSLFVIFFVAIDLFRKFTNKEKWALVKTVCYSLSIALLVVMVLIALVIVF
jgi:undecaprenyl pyrophosphate phosphatase UppP